MITVDTEKMLHDLATLNKELAVIRDNAAARGDASLAEKTIEAMHKVSDAFGSLIEVDDYIAKNVLK